MLVRVVSVKMAELSSLKCSSSWKATRKLAKNGQNWLFRKSKLAKALQQPGKCMFRKKWLNLAQLVKNPPAMWENWVWSLGLEDPLEKGKATHSGLENSRDYIVHGVAKSQTRLSNFHFHGPSTDWEHRLAHAATYSLTYSSARFKWESDPSPCFLQLFSSSMCLLPFPTFQMQRLHRTVFRENLCSHILWAQVLLCPPYKWKA